MEFPAKISNIAEKAEQAKFEYECRWYGCFHISELRGVELPKNTQTPKLSEL